MSHPLEINNFFFKGIVKFGRKRHEVDIIDPKTSQVIMSGREYQLSGLTKFLRFTPFFMWTPFHVEIKSSKGEQILSFKRGGSFGFSDISIFDENGRFIGKIVPIFKVGGRKIEIYDH